MIKNILFTVGLLSMMVLPNWAHDDHDHSHDVGPNGGRIIAKVTPHAEFFVTPERKVEIRFLDEDLKVVEAKESAVTVTTGTRRAPVVMSFVRQNNVLVSEQVLPDGNNHPTVVRIKVAADSKTVTEKFNLNLNKCPDSGHAEYAVGHQH